MRLLPAATALILICACGGSATTSPQPAQATVTGTVRLAPCRPVERIGDPPCPPVPGVRVEFASVAGGPHTGAVTDAAGSYSVRLAPGSYQTSVSRGLGRTSERVTVAAGELLQLDLSVDVGIR